MAKQSPHGGEGSNTPPSSGQSSPHYGGHQLVPETHGDETSRHGAAMAPGSLPPPLPGSHPPPTHAGDDPPLTPVQDAGVGSHHPGHASVLVGREGILHTPQRRKTRSPGEGSVGHADTSRPEQVRIKTGDKRTRQDRKDNPSGESAESEKQARPPPPTLSMHPSPIRRMVLHEHEELRESSTAEATIVEQTTVPTGRPITYGTNLLTPVGSPAPDLPVSAPASVPSTAVASPPVQHDPADASRMQRIQEAGIEHRGAMQVLQDQGIDMLQEELERLFDEEFAQNDETSTEQSQARAEPQGNRGSIDYVGAPAGNLPEVVEVMSPSPMEDSSFDTAASSSPEDIRMQQHSQRGNPPQPGNGMSQEHQRQQSGRRTSEDRARTRPDTTSEPIAKRQSVAQHLPAPPSTTTVHNTHHDVRTSPATATMQRPPFSGGAPWPPDAPAALTRLAEQRHVSTRLRQGFNQPAPQEVTDSRPREEYDVVSAEHDRLRDAQKRLVQAQEQAEAHASSLQTELVAANDRNKSLAESIVAIRDQQIADNTQQQQQFQTYVKQLVSQTSQKYKDRLRIDKEQRQTKELTVQETWAVEKSTLTAEIEQLRKDLRTLQVSDQAASSSAPQVDTGAGVGELEDVPRSCIRGRSTEPRGSIGNADTTTGNRPERSVSITRATQTWVPPTTVDDDDDGHDQTDHHAGDEWQGDQHDYDAQGYDQDYDAEGEYNDDDDDDDDDLGQAPIPSRRNSRDASVPATTRGRSSTRRQSRSKSASRSPVNTDDSTLSSSDTSSRSVRRNKTRESSEVRRLKEKLAQQTKKLQKYRDKSSDKEAGAKSSKASASKSRAAGSVDHVDKPGSSKDKKKKQSKKDSSGSTDDVDTSARKRSGSKRK